MTKRFYVFVGDTTYEDIVDDFSERRGGPIVHTGELGDFFDAETRGKAKSQAFQALQSAGYRVEYVDLRTRVMK